MESGKQISSATVTSSSPVVGHISSYVVTLVTPNGIVSGDQILFTMPSDLSTPLSTYFSSCEGIAYLSK